MPGENKGRWLHVAWAPNPTDLYVTALRIVARDRSGLVLDIATVLNSLKAKVRSLNARGVADGNAMVYVALEVPIWRL